ncbi:hypothetical protein [Burkholderia sp. LMG 13014]|uniref:hypothetical protein n=1 Tax=Burkholderia sp. LMG 13014 TaxID=2709306 RepID=UPI001963E219|nr:hypothetical protein [Burkholderia sp. LMG 13014]
MATTGDVVQRAQGLVKRLDRCWAGLDAMSAERAQALIYAGFLSDVVNGGFGADEPELGEMVGLVDDFCALAEAEAAAH